MSKKKLVLHTETLKALSSQESAQVQGGIYTLEYQCNTDGACIPYTEYKCDRTGHFCN